MRDKIESLKGYITEILAAKAEGPIDAERREKEAKSIGSFIEHMLLEEARKLEGLESKNAKLMERLERILGEDEPVVAEFWSRDCDMCESSHMCRFDSWLDYERAVKEFYEDLEGPGSVNLRTEEDWAEYQGPQSRDRMLEAFENGKGNSVVI